MNSLSDLIDNIYSNLELNSECKNICSIKNIPKECLTKVNSRYKLPGINYIPYNITVDFYKKLFDKIIIVPDLMGGSRDPLVTYNNKYVIVRLCNKLDDLLYNGDFTTNGLLALRYKRCFGNYDFRDKVNSELSKFMIYYEHKLSRYFIDKEIYQLIIKYSDDLLTDKLVSKYGFRWRD